MSRMTAIRMTAIAITTFLMAGLGTCQLTSAQDVPIQTAGQSDEVIHLEDPESDPVATPVEVIHLDELPNSEPGQPARTLQPSTNPNYRFDPSLAKRKEHSTLPAKITLVVSAALIVVPAVALVVISAVDGTSDPFFISAIVSFFGALVGSVGLVVGGVMLGVRRRQNREARGLRFTGNGFQLSF